MMLSRYQSETDRRRESLETRLRKEMQDAEIEAFRRLNEAAARRNGLTYLDGDAADAAEEEYVAARAAVRTLLGI